MPLFEVEFATTVYASDSVTVEADTEDEAVDMAYGEMSWRYDEVEIIHVEEV